jgi:hypothetical protein
MESWRVQSTVTWTDLAAFESLEMSFIVVTALSRCLSNAEKSKAARRSRPSSVYEDQEAEYKIVSGPVLLFISSAGQRGEVKTSTPLFLLGNLSLSLRAFAHGGTVLHERHSGMRRDKGVWPWLSSGKRDYLRRLLR